MTSKEELRLFAQKLGLKNQTQIANILQITLATVADWNRGEYPIPKRALAHMRSIIRVKELEEEIGKLKAMKRGAKR